MLTNWAVLKFIEDRLISFFNLALSENGIPIGGFTPYYDIGRMSEDVLRKIFSKTNGQCYRTGISN